MFKIDKETKEIQITRGDIGCIKVQATEEDTESLYIFKLDDVVRLKVTEAKNPDNVVLVKDVKVVEEGLDYVKLHLTKTNTKIGDLISKRVKYWYEVELNPDTNPQTIIGYDEDGPKLFTLYPEGGEGQQ